MPSEGSQWNWRRPAADWIYPKPIAKNEWTFPGDPPGRNDRLSARARCPRRRRVAMPEIPRWPCGRSGGVPGKTLIGRFLGERMIEAIDRQLIQAFRNEDQTGFTESSQSVREIIVVQG